MKKEKAVETGNIFKLRTKFSLAFNLKFKDRSGGENLVEMGCYGIGLSRLMGILVELFSDEKGIIWPKEVSPFQVHLIALQGGEKQAVKIYQELLDLGIEVLYDDRIEKTAGEKFSEADLIGIPLRVVASEKTVAKNKIEVKERNKNSASMVDLQGLLKKIKNYL